MRIRLSAALLLLFVSVPASASAHGLGSEDPNRPVAEYLWLGITHLLAGWDHLLFILAICLVAGSLWRATKLMSMFVLGHSITLALATSQEWRVSATFVDVVIALSVVTVAVIGFRRKEPNWKAVGIGLFGFGLVHGLGLSTRLQDLGVSDDSLGLRVLLFNIGIEIGQAVAVLAFFAAGWALVRAWRRPAGLVRPAFGVIAAAGLIGAAIVAAEGDDGGTDTSVISNAEALRTCTQADTAPPPFIGGGHPAKMFFGPDDEVPVDDLVHVAGDGAVVVRYQPDLSPAEVKELEAFVGHPDSRQFVVGAPAPDQREPVKAFTNNRTLTCDEFDAEDLASFRDEWFASVSSRQPQP